MGNVEGKEHLSFAHALSAVLQQEFGQNRSALKLIIRITGVGERTAKNWLEGKNAPNGENLIELMRHSDCVLRAVLWLAGQDDLLLAKSLLTARDELLKIADLIEEVLELETKES